VLFQLDYDDARTMEQRFAPMTAQDLMGLGHYEIALRPCLDGRTAGVVTATTLPPVEAVTDATMLAAASRQRYGVDRADVEAALLARIQTNTSERGYGRTARRRSS
jgi:hypothetical protein